MIISAILDVWRQSSGTKCTWTLTWKVLKSTPFSYGVSHLITANIRYSIWKVLIFLWNVTFLQNLFRQLFCYRIVLSHTSCLQFVTNLSNLFLGETRMTIQGNVRFDKTMPLPSPSCLVVKLQESSRMDAPSATLATMKKDISYHNTQDPVPYRIEAH